MKEYREEMGWKRPEAWEYTPWSPLMTRWRKPYSV
jgi:hypothetical protein